ncbi:MAG: hypothetical protein OEV06_08380 [Anaerolineae bacterium]|nr:hypothetical protein [Anaerolineae bacterium]
MAAGRLFCKGVVDLGVSVVVWNVVGCVAATGQKKFLHLTQKLPRRAIGKAKG